MARGNPLQTAIGRKTLSQSVSNPVGNTENTTGNSAKLRVPAAKTSTISQSVKNPVGKRKLNKTGAGGAA
jgi:hypothetical protein